MASARRGSPPGSLPGGCPSSRSARRRSSRRLPTVEQVKTVAVAGASAGPRSRWTRRLDHPRCQVHVGASGQVLVAFGRKPADYKAHVDAGCECRELCHVMRRARTRAEGRRAGRVAAAPGTLRPASLRGRRSTPCPSRPSPAPGHRRLRCGDERPPRREPPQLRRRLLAATREWRRGSGACLRRVKAGMLWVMSSDIVRPRRSGRVRGGSAVDCSAGGAGSCGWVAAHEKELDVLR